MDIVRLWRHWCGEWHMKTTNTLGGWPDSICFDNRTTAIVIVTVAVVVVRVAAALLICFLQFLQSNIFIGDFYKCLCVAHIASCVTKQRDQSNVISFSCFL